MMRLPSWSTSHHIACTTMMCLPFWSTHHLKDIVSFSFAFANFRYFLQRLSGAFGFQHGSRESTPGRRCMGSEVIVWCMVRELYDQNIASSASDCEEVSLTLTLAGCGFGWNFFSVILNPNDIRYLGTLNAFCVFIFLCYGVVFGSGEKCPNRQSIIYLRILTW